MTVRSSSNAPAKVTALTPAQKRQQQAAARAMLGEERRLLRGIRDDVSEVADGAIAEIARRDDTTSDAARAAILMLLLAAADRLRTRTRVRIAAARLSARVSGAKRAHVEIGTAMAAAGLGALLLDGHHPHAPDDRSLAEATADSFASAWKSGLVYAVTQAIRKGESPTRAVDLAAERLDGRARRIAATEVPQAYNDAHRREAERSGAALNDTATSVALIVRRWDAILDVRTCPECRSHDGEVTPLGRAFDGGDEPGTIHPWCRCIDTVITIPRMRV